MAHPPHRSRSRKADSNTAKATMTVYKDETRMHLDGDDDDDDEEDALNKLVFGNGAARVDLPLTRVSNEHDDDDDADAWAQDEEAAGGGDDAEVVGYEALDDAELFYMDTGHDRPAETTGDAPAWEDSDDDRIVVSLAGHARLRKLRVTEDEDVVSGREYTTRLRAQFERLHPVPEWASQQRPSKRRRRSSMSSDSEMEDQMVAMPLARLLQDANALMPGRRSATVLRPEVIDIQRTRDIPTVQSGPVTAVSFHPRHPVLLSTGPASILYLHRLDATANPTPHPLITSVQIKNNQLRTAAFDRPAGERIVFGGMRRYYHTWNLKSGDIQKVSRIYGQEARRMDRFKLSPCGRYMGLVGTSKKLGGEIHILNAHTSQWIANARIEGRHGVADFHWWRDGEGFTVVSKSGECGEYSVASQSFVARWVDDIGATVVTLGGSGGPSHIGGDRWVAIGSESGVTNLYDRHHLSQPKRALKQLTTPIDVLTISPDGQCLAMSSRAKQDALRLVHLPSCTVYKNWPTGKTPLGRVSAVSWSPGSDMLAVGNDVGKVRLWEVRR